MQEFGEIQLNRMSEGEYAAYTRILGHKEIEVKGALWNQVRPFFFRPLLTYREYAPNMIRAPRSSLFGGFQHAVPAGAKSNSLLTFRIFENAGTYALASLDQNRRRQVRVAGEHLAIRPIDDVNEFRTNAYPVYQSFAERTRYETGAWRRHASGFSKWADDLFQVPKILVLGGYEGSRMRGVSVSMWVGDTVVYATSFCDTESLRWYLPDLMLHAVRVIASNHPEVNQLYAGMCVDERGLDGFYLLRGCRCVKKPAWLHLNPVTGLVLRIGMPHLYAKLLGK
jgi:hypothetical protein